MAGYVLSCCSTVDLTHEWLGRRNITYLCFNYQLGDKTHKDDFGVTTPPAQLYAKMLAGEGVKTSQISAGEYLEHFERFLKQGQDVLHVCLSTGISGTYGSACSAAEELSRKYPERKVLVVDSLAASSGYGLLMDKLADLRDEGMGVEELATWATEHREKVNHWFFSSDLTFFVRGGRISRAAGVMGGLLKICPVMDVAPDGSLRVKEKIRTKARAIARDLELMEQLAEGGLDYDQKCFICQSECLDDARELARRVEEKFPKLDGRVEIFPIGATIGCHTGPGTVALFFWGKPRTQQ
ncbi:DegV family protein [Thermophilibacter immobilis]|uniref:DegV family protein n=1 Tax=Thermophilibacter immobilis TaxID=2779519 RepID=A0A7S7M9K2_9ACTN|nr:DegV family protein [Thermophilibacter immobilis]QOY61138.1 DegV family protein [Thermophilibacter immobilis]